MVIPFKNRTIVRMMTVATSSFSATNLIIGATVGAVKSGGNPALFAKEFVLRINFVGLGRCAVAIGADVSSGIKKTKLEYQLGRVDEQIIALTNAKTYYCVGGIWKEIEDTEAATQELENTVVLSVKKAYDYWNATKQNMERIEENIDVLTEDESFRDHLLDILNWG